MGYTYFRDRCHRAFEKNKEDADPQQIVRHLSRGEFIIKELEALYRLKKYRYLKQRYYPDHQENQKSSDSNSETTSVADSETVMMKKIERQKQ